MVQTPSGEEPKNIRKPHLRLPFENRRQDAGSWTYDHRVGLCVTLIAYLVLMIVFVSSRIVVARRELSPSLYVDVALLEEPERERPEEERPERPAVPQEPVDWRSVRNLTSNENASPDARVRDDRGTDVAALNNAAAVAAERMRANREAYEQGLAEERAIRERAGNDSVGEAEDRKVKGRVTVSFSLVDPIRTLRRPSIPAYLCEGGGEVTVGITVSRSGEVTAARILSGNDDCMCETALRAARATRFNIDERAPIRHNGTITYLFIPQ